MRIVAGTAGGRRLVAPDGDTTRPTTDRVREATFNALYSLGLIDGAVYCDLFAGSGALGLEAISRGAANVTFVERDRAALAALQTNIDTLGFGDRATVVATDALRFVAQEQGRAFDVVLADPPYDFDEWDQLLAAQPGSVIVAESNDPIEPPADREVLRARSYGSTIVTILSRSTSLRLDASSTPGAP